jgi:hypothetical protein
MPPFHAEDLEALLAFNPDDDAPEVGAMPLRADCHPEAAIRAAYDVGWEAVLMTCATCGRGHMAIAVDRQPPRPQDARG